MKVLVFLLRRSWRVFTIGMALGVVSGAATTGLVSLISRVALRPDAPATYAWMFVALCPVVLGVGFACQYLIVRLAQDAIVDLRVHLSRRLLAMPLRGLEQLGTHRVLSTMTNEVVTITNILPSAPILATNLAVVLTCLVYLGVLSLKALAATLAFMVFGVITFNLQQGRALRNFRLAFGKQALLLKELRGVTDGAKELKLNAARREAFIEHNLLATANEVRGHALTANRYLITSSIWGRMLFLVGAGMLLFLGRRILHLDSVVTGSYALVLLYMLGPIESIFAILPVLGVASAAWQKVQELDRQVLEVGAEEAGASSATDGTKLAPESIELSGVTHTYFNERDGSKFTLGPIDLTLRRGEILFVVGANGSGKSTLAKLLVGLYMPESGKVRIDGVEVTPAERERYRQHFATVFSDYYLFETLRGLPRTDIDDRARGYLVDLQLDRKVRVENGRFSTTDLSQGQRKRLALLSACMEDRPIMVFDEWAADQDPTFKQIFYHKILPDLRSAGKTLIVVSHDDRYFSAADRIIRLEEGRIVADRDARTSAPHSAVPAVSA